MKIYTTPLKDYGEIRMGELHQWDQGQVLVLEETNLTTAPLVHFSHKRDETAFVVQSVLSDGILKANIPNKLLESHEDIFAHVSQDDTVLLLVRLDVKKRAKPNNYVEDPTQSTTWGEIMEAANKVAEAVDAIKEVTSSFEETKDFVQAAKEATETAAINAETSAASALESKNGAAAEATKAANSATAAAGSAGSAKNESDRATDEASKSASSATAAKASEDAAMVSKTGAENAKKAAESANTAAQSAKTSAETSESNAKKYADAANTSASQAATSAGNASASATEATASATSANAKAIEAKTSADTATAKASEAAQSAIDAANSATSVAGEADRAATEATKAEKAANSAKTSENLVISAKDAAEAAKTGAENAKKAAESANTAAQSAKTSAETSESNAKKYADAANTSAGQAATSATNAAKSSQEADTAKQAAQSANTSAQGAKTAAQTAQTAAEAAQAAAEQARDEAQDIAGGDYASNAALKLHTENAAIHVTATEKQEWGNKLDGSALIPYSKTSDLNSHTNDNVKHITATERTAWNAKLDNSALNDYATEGHVSTKVTEHNTSAVAHNDIRILIEGLTSRLNALADSDDTTLDQMSEIVAYIKNNKSLIDNITTSKINVVDIINNLTTNITNKPLSAAQGVALKALIDDVAANAGKIDTIKVNGTAQTITDKAVNISVPTKTSEIQNDSGYLKEHQNLAEYAKTADVNASLGNKVDKVAGKGLSTCDFTYADSGKLNSAVIIDDLIYKNVTGITDIRELLVPDEYYEHWFFVDGKKSPINAVPLPNEEFLINYNRMPNSYEYRIILTYYNLGRVFTTSIPEADLEEISWKEVGVSKEYVDSLMLVDTETVV